MNYSIEELEANIKQAKEEVELGAALERLFSNRDFKKVVLNGYFEKEAIRLVYMKGEATLPTDHEKIVLQIDSIGTFRKYLKNITVSAELAKKAMEADEQTRDEITYEDLNNG